MMHEDHSEYAWPYYTLFSSAEGTANAIIDWCAAFGPPTSFQTNSPTYLRQEVIRCQNVRYGTNNTSHKCTARGATVPWSDWSKKILRACRALISELQLLIESWPDRIPIIKELLNYSPSLQKNNIVSFTVFFGLSLATLSWHIWDRTHPQSWRSPRRSW